MHGLPPELIFDEDFRMEMFASFVSSRKSRIGRSRHHSKPNRDAALGLLANQFVADPWSATRVTLQYGTEMNAIIDVLFAASTSLAVGRTSQAIPSALPCPASCWRL
jgi:hypothetical protein